MTTTPVQPQGEDRRPRILCVDDEPNNLHALRQILNNDYRLQFATDGRRALQLVQQQPPDLVLLDVMMPALGGYDVCRQIKADPATRDIPVIFVSALSDTGDELQGFEAGGVDYIVKPIRAPIVRARVRSHLSLVRADALRESRKQIVSILGRAAEYRDNETGMHVIRVGKFAQMLALTVGCSEDWSEELLMAATLHDVGKLGIPDAILLKPGRLDDEEMVIMRRHAEIGAEILGKHTDPLLAMSREIALSHHEKWDGSGYPRRLAGENIPLSARIVALVDVFDALTSERPYKRAWSVDEAFALIEKDSGTHFDPTLAQAFLSQREKIERIREDFKD